MKQVVIQGGGVRVIDVPAPQVSPRSILVRVAHSCISAGTEIAGVQSASEPLYRRALKQPEKVKRALAMMREHGVRYTLDRARGEAIAIPLGYSAAGTVITAGDEVDYFAPGDRVACAGAGLANHAEIVDVPVNLAVKIPQGVDTEAASTVALGAIALQGVRRAAPQLGETVLVIGLGLVGQVTVQLLRASGCRVIGVEPDPARAEVAQLGGLQLLVPAVNYSDEVRRLTGGFGADAVVVTAASANEAVVNEAARACRRKGRLVVVGDVKLDLDRTELYARELDVLIATSYGPGRYDPVYELEGADYPLPYVRWTENRNMASYLDLLAAGAVSLGHLSRQLHDVDHAVAAYGALSRPGEKPLLSLLRYPESAVAAARHIVLRGQPRAASGAVRIAVVGAGSFAQAIHLPNIARLGHMFSLAGVMSRTGTTARMAAERFGARFATTDFDAVLADSDVDAVLIATRHNLHARLALAALRAGKHVFLEKPLATTPEDLDTLERFFAETESSPLLLTGFNRRFSPAARQAKNLLERRRTPLVASYRMNAGYIAPDHWVHGKEGGGRNIGEACHVYDLFGYLTRSRPVAVQADAISPSGPDLRRDDNFTATVRYEDGSLCTLTYTALGAPEYPKERLDVFAGTAVLTLDDYKRLDVSGGDGKGWSNDSSDKGHLACLEAFGTGVRSGTWPAPIHDQIAATRVSFLVEEQLRAPRQR